MGVLFDWDGVIIDSLGASFNVYNRIFADMGARQLTMDEFLRVQSPNWYEFYQKIGLPEKFWKEADEKWVRLYGNESPGLHTDTIRCLSTLKAKFRLALVSNGSESRIDAELTKFRLRHFFDSVMSGVPREHLKPSPFMIKKTMNVLCIEPDQAVFIGDSPADIQAAKNAGVLSIALAREPIQAERLKVERPDHIFNGLGPVTKFLIEGAKI